MTEFFGLRHFYQINLFLWRFASMPRSQRNDNFIDKTFTVIADILLKILPTSNKEKQAST
jgi:hypothetical protein